MDDFRLRTDLTRAIVDGFALPLGIQPIAGLPGGGLRAPTQGYTLTYTPGEEDDPDTYTFHIVVSHERLAELIHRAFGLLPEEVFAIVEIGSRDAYRQMDVFLGGESVTREQFLSTWRQYETILLEDASIAAGANSDEPFVEVFIDQWKSVSIHVPLDMRDEVEAILHSLGLEEVAQTWPPETDEQREAAGSHICPVLDLTDPYAADIDELLLNLRHEWRLELNVDPDDNVDEGGRRLGMTLWQALVIIESEDEPDAGAYMSIWATAGSLTQMMQIVEHAVQSQPGWQFSEVYTVDRVAFDERPDELADLPPRRTQPEIHLIQIDPWDEDPSPGNESGPRRESLRPGDDPRLD